MLNFGGVFISDIDMGNMWECPQKWVRYCTKTYKNPVLNLVYLSGYETNGIKGVPSFWFLHYHKKTLHNDRTLTGRILIVT